MALDAFARGDMETLPLEHINAIVAEIWHGFVEYNVEADALQSVPQPPARSMGVCPTLNINLPKYQPVPISAADPSQKSLRQSPSSVPDGLVGCGSNRPWRRLRSKQLSLYEINRQAQSRR